MRLQLVPSTVAGDAPDQLLSSYLIDDNICIDAGSIGFHADLEQQLQVKHLFITHSHSDHVASLPMFLDAHFGEDSASKQQVTIYATRATATSLREDIFNDRHWPDFFRISAENGLDLLELQEIEERVPIEVDGMRITPIPVDHIVDTVAYIVEGDGSSCAIVTDTGPTEEIWKRCDEIKNLTTVVLEASFPNRLQWLADVSKHLTPETFRVDRAKASDPDRLKFLAVHIKPNQREETVKELAAMELPGVEVMEPGRDYQF